MPRPVLRDRTEREVSPLELLFDLVFVLGVSQLTRHLVVRHTWRGAAETLVLYLPVFAVWAYTSWAATLYSPRHPGASRMLIAVMAAGLFMNASLTRAFRDSAWVFVVPFLGIQLGRTAWMLTTPLDQTNRGHFVRTLAWLAATAPLWIAGATVSTQPRLLVWGIAAAIDLSGVLLAHPLFHRRLHSDRVEFGSEHLLERFRLFLLIALGETIVTPGAALAAAPIKVTTLASGTVALAATLCLWWLYFRGEPIAQSQVAGAEDRVSAIRMGANGLPMMIAGLIVLAAGNALVIDDPSRQASRALALMLFGGPTMFLVARAWYQWRVFGMAPRTQLTTIGLLAATGAAAARTVPALAAALAATAVLASLVILEHPNVTRNCRWLGGEGTSVAK